MTTQRILAALVVAGLLSGAAFAGDKTPEKSAKDTKNCCMDKEKSGACADKAKAGMDCGMSGMKASKDGKAEAGKMSCCSGHAAKTSGNASTSTKDKK